MKNTVTTILTLTVVLNSCNKPCEEIISRHENGKIQVVHRFNNCSDSSAYERTYFYDNGQMGSTGFVKNGVKHGQYKFWNELGVQTAKWEMKDGKEHGPVQCWYDNGIKSKEAALIEGKQHGIERTWHENGRLATTGEYTHGVRTGSWKFFDENGGWKIRNYQHGEFHGPTNEHLLDSTGKITLVVGQYENGLETGLWRWFDKDSTLYQTAVYKNGKANGEVIEYYADGSVKLRGNLVDGGYDGEVKHYDNKGTLIKIERYRGGELIHD